MIFKATINTEIEIKDISDLPKLKILLEVNNLEKPNFSKLARELGVDRRTVKKHYESKYKKHKKEKGSKLDEYNDLIYKLLSNETSQVFHYKTHLYRYLVREHGLKCSRSNFNYFILNNEDFAKYFKPKGNSNSIKSETPFGKQAQFDWKEKLNFKFKDGSEFIFNVGSLVLSASRFKVWTICPSTNQSYLFDFLANAFETVGGVPKELLIDNASTMMDKARTERSKGKTNPKFQQLADDFGFKIVPCIRARPNTKAKVENPMRIIDEIMAYSGTLNNVEELYDKMNVITNEANARICQATGLPPILVFKKEKEHLSPLPHRKICSFYKNITETARVNTNGLFKYKGNMYSVPAKLIGKIITIEVADDNLNVYYNKKLITIHSISNKKVNYHEKHHIEMLNLTFRNKEEEEMRLCVDNHFKEMEKFNEQISTIATEFKGP